MPVSPRNSTVSPASAPAAVVSSAIPPEEVPVEEASVPLELGVHKRFVIFDVLYEADIVYMFSQKMAEYMLQRKSDLGIPVFKRYVPRVKRAINEDGMPTVDLSRADLPPRLSKAQQQRIDMGNASELVEAGIELPEDSGVEV